MLSEIGDDDKPATFDADQAVEHVRNAWLTLQVFDHVDVGTSGGYAFEPSEYAPVPVQIDGDETVVFAKT